MQTALTLKGYLDLLVNISRRIERFQINIDLDHFHFSVYNEKYDFIFHDGRLLIEKCINILLKTFGIKVISTGAVPNITLNKKLKILKKSKLGKMTNCKIFCGIASTVKELGNIKIHGDETKNYNFTLIDSHMIVPLILKSIELTIDLLNGENSLSLDEYRYFFREGDWLCLQCQNINWASKEMCNKCNFSKPKNAPILKHGPEKSRKSIKNTNLENPTKILWVGNIPKNIQSQEFVQFIHNLVDRSKLESIFIREGKGEWDYGFVNCKTVRTAKIVKEAILKNKDLLENFNPTFQYK